MTNKLTAKGVEKLKQPGRYRDGEVKGLYLQVLSPDNRSWVLRYEKHSRAHMLGLGSVRDFNLKEARERARKARQQLADGVDPIMAKREAKTKAALEANRALTFKEAAEAYYRAHGDKWSNAKHRAQFIGSLKSHAFGKIGHLLIKDIGVPEVLSVLEPIWKTTQETASRVRARIEAVIGWATVRGLRSGDNPARWSKFLETQLIKVQSDEHHPALPYEQLPEFMAMLRTRPALTARAFEFLILTAARTGAVIGATWDEIDTGKKIWTVPASRTGTKITSKNGEVRDRQVPLCDDAIALLRKLPREDDNSHIFIGPSGGGGISTNAMPKLIERINETRANAGLPIYVDPKQGSKEITVHGMRSTFKDWCLEQTAFDSVVSEAALWHRSADKVERAYARGQLLEKRRQLMDQWSRYCAGKTVIEPGSNVIPIGSAG